MCKYTYTYIAMVRFRYFFILLVGVTAERFHQNENARAHRQQPNRPRVDRDTLNFQDEYQYVDVDIYDNRRPDKIDNNEQVIDTTPAVNKISFFNCPTRDISHDNEIGKGYKHVYYPEPIARLPNGQPIPVDLEATNRNIKQGSKFPIGKTEMKFIAKYDGANTSVCRYNIVIKDVEAPTFLSCPASRVIPSNKHVFHNARETSGRQNNTVSSVVEYETITAVDNSGYAPKIRLIMGLKSGNVFPQGATEVVYEAIDKFGNKDECKFTVSIQEHKLPSQFTPSAPKPSPQSPPPDSSSMNPRPQSLHAHHRNGANRNGPYRTGGAIDLQMQTYTDRSSTDRLHRENGYGLHPFSQYNAQQRRLISRENKLLKKGNEKKSDKILRTTEKRKLQMWRQQLLQALQGQESYPIATNSLIQNNNYNENPIMGTFNKLASTLLQPSNRDDTVSRTPNYSNAQIISKPQMVAKPQIMGTPQMVTNPQVNDKLYIEGKSDKVSETYNSVNNQKKDINPKGFSLPTELHMNVKNENKQGTAVTSTSHIRSTSKIKAKETGKHGKEKVANDIDTSPDKSVMNKDQSSVPVRSKQELSEIEEPSANSTEAELQQHLQILFDSMSAKQPSKNSEVYNVLLHPISSEDVQIKDSGEHLNSNSNNNNNKIENSKIANNGYVALGPQLNDGGTATLNPINNVRNTIPSESTNMDFESNNRAALMNNDIRQSKAINNNQAGVKTKIVNDEDNNNDFKPQTALNSFTELPSHDKILADSAPKRQQSKRFGPHFIKKVQNLHWNEESVNSILHNVNNLIDAFQ